MIDQHWDFGSEADNKRLVTALLEELEGQIKAIFAEHQGLNELTAFLGATRDPMTQRPFKGLNILILGSHSDFNLRMSGQDKSLFTSIVEKAAHMSNSIIVAIVSEAWVVCPEGEEAINEVRRYMEAHNSISECPHRREVVMVHLEHSRLTPRHQVWIAPIEETESSRTIGKFEVQDFPEMKTRFDCLLPKFEDPKPDPYMVS